MRWHLQNMLQEVLGHLPHTRWGHWARSCRPCREALGAAPEALWAPLAASLGWEEGGGAATATRSPRAYALERRGAHWCRVHGSATSELLPRNLWWVSVRRWVSGVGISWVARCVQLPRSKGAPQSARLHRPPTCHSMQS